jgi:hypothetical protein
LQASERGKRRREREREREAGGSENPKPSWKEEEDLGKMQIYKL